MPTENSVCLKDFDAVLVSGPEPGEMGVIMARAGAGKTACLTHLAIGCLLRDKAVLHVCVDIVPDKVKVWYHELLKSLFSEKAGCDIPAMQHRIEPLRFIMSFLNQTFSPDKLEQSIENLRQQAKFSPSLIILDGLDFGRNPRPVLEEISKIALRQSVPIWMSATMHRHIAEVNERGIPYPVNSLDDLFSSILMLEPGGEGLKLKVLKQKSDYSPGDSEFLLNPHTFELLKKSA